MLLKCCQTGDIHPLSRKPVPISDLPLGKEVLPNVQSKPPLVQVSSPSWLQELWLPGSGPLLLPHFPVVLIVTALQSS